VDHIRSKSRDHHVIRVAYPLAQYRTHKTVVDAAIRRVLDGGAYILGREVETFEQGFAARHAGAHAIGVGNGTDALILALRGLGIGPGDEAITVAHTAIATVAAVLATGATPVIVDVDPVYYTLDPTRIAAAVGKRTKAIVPVHIYGQPADMTAIMKVARRLRLKVVEDCAQAAGATFEGRAVGTFGDAGTFSFYPTKNLGAIGDGGIVVTANPRLAEAIRRLRQYGWDEKRVAGKPGVNSRLDPIQAAILGAKLPALGAENKRRGALAARYAKGLAGLPVTAPAIAAGAGHAWHLYVISCPDRDALRRTLEDRSIETAIHYPVPAHRQKGYAGRLRVSKQGLPVTEKLARRILSLPLYPELADDEADTVIAAIRAHYEHGARR